MEIAIIGAGGMSREVLFFSDNDIHKYEIKKLFADDWESNKYDPFHLLLIRQRLLVL